MNYKISNSLILEVLKPENRETLLSNEFESPLDALLYILTRDFNSNIKGREITDRIVEETKLLNEISNIIYRRRLTKMNPQYRLPYGCRDDYNYDLD